MRSEAPGHTALTVFVTGTDTGVGKTLISAAMLHGLARHHGRVVGMKPVAAGLVQVDGQWVSEDALALRAASTVRVPPELDNPVALPDPLSPHLAAQRAGRHVTVAELLQAQRRLQAHADLVLVEGAGGWRVPLNDSETLADLARALAAPVVLVVGLRLGCLNHALLTAAAIRADGLRLAGWVANAIDPDMACRDENIATLQARLGAPLLGVVPWMAQPDARQIPLHWPADEALLQPRPKPSAQATAAASWLDDFDAGLAALDAQNLRRTRRTVRPAGQAHLMVDGQRLLAFCSNDYLGLSQHAQPRAAAQAALATYGVGAGASPMVSGHSAANAALELELAAAVGLPRALYFYAGYATNASAVEALVGPGDAVFSDALNHACLIDGARLSKARVHRYAHADLSDLAHQLQASPARRKLVLSDAVFSMDGTLADVAGLLGLCERHDALLMLDDAHGFGVLGPQGRGTLAAAALTAARASDRVLYMATLGKALGVAGAFVAGPERLVEWLLQKTRSYTYATAAPALLAEALRASLHCALGPEGDERRQRLNARIRQLRAALAPGCDENFDARGWQLMASDTAIQPLVVGDAAAALALMEQLRRAGLWVPAIRPPTVPLGTARLRIALSAEHRAEDVERLVQVLREAARQG